jgi:tetratricopeptide (TPR) repeat protein
MKSRWQARNGDNQHPPVEMRFIDMFMTALGSLVFVALLLVFLLPKTTQTKSKDEEIQRLQQENQQLRKQIPQTASAPGGAQTQDKEIVLRQFAVLLVTSGCTSNQQPDLYVRTESKIVNFKTNDPMGEALPFDASNPESRTILIEHKYFNFGSDLHQEDLVAPLQKAGLHTKLFLAVARSAGSYSVYAALPNPQLQDGNGCTVYPFYLSSRGVDQGDEITLTRQRPYAWLRRFSISSNGANTANIRPGADEVFKRDLAEFSKKQSQLLCERKTICGTMDAHYAFLVPPPPPPSYDSYVRGVAFEQKGDFENAIANFTEAIRIDPNYALAFYDRGKSYKGKGDLAQAVADYGEAIRIDPNNALAFYDRGIAYKARGYLERAISDFDEAIRIEPNADRLYNRGLVYLEKGDLGHAIEDLSLALRDKPGYAAALDDRGRAYKARGELEQAIADYNGAIAYEPTANRFEKRGLALFARGDVDRAIADYSEAIKRDPKFADAYSDLGLAYQSKADFVRAIAGFDEAIRIEPNAGHYHARGAAYASSGDLEHAIADYNEALRLDPNHVPSLLDRAVAYRVKGELDRSISDLGEALRMAPDTSTFNARAEAYFAKQDFQNATADYSEALRLDPTNQSVYTKRGIAHFFGGSRAKAQSDFKQASQLDPKDPYAALWLELAERANGLPSVLSSRALQFDMQTWPAPIVHLFLGELTSVQVVAAAQSSDRNVAQRQICQTDFYAGEFALLQSSDDEARRLLRRATEDCPLAFIERVAASAQLKVIAVNEEKR